MKAFLNVSGSDGVSRALSLALMIMAWLLAFLCSVLVFMDENVNLGIEHTGLFFVRTAGVVVMWAAAFGFLRLPGLFVVWVGALGEGVRLLVMQGPLRFTDENAYYYYYYYGLGIGLVIAGVLNLALIAWMAARGTSAQSVS